jgi:hypothetical protein
MMTEHEGVKIFFTFDYFPPFMIVDSDARKIGNNFISTERLKVQGRLTSTYFIS